MDKKSDLLSSQNNIEVLNLTFLGEATGRVKRTLHDERNGGYLKTQVCVCECVTQQSNMLLHWARWASLPTAAQLTTHYTLDIIVDRSQDLSYTTFLEERGWFQKQKIT